MKESKNVSGTDFAKVDAHVITAEEYEEIPELDDDFFENAVWQIDGKPFTPPAKVGRPPKENPKQATTIRLDPDILAAFKAGGKGWQTRINNALREYLEAKGLAAEVKA